MKIRPSLGEYASAVVAFLVVLSGADTVLGQQEVRLEKWTDIPFEISLGAVQPAPAEEELSSVEEGATPLDEAFDWRQYRLEKRQGALKDTKVEFNFRTFFLDRHKFDGSESQAW